jgi:hypothetical protein
MPSSGDILMLTIVKPDTIINVTWSQVSCGTGATALKREVPNNRLKYVVIYIMTYSKRIGARATGFYVVCARQIHRAEVSNSVPAEVTI